MGCGVSKATADEAPDVIPAADAASDGGPPPTLLASARQTTQPGRGGSQKAACEAGVAPAAEGLGADCGAAAPAEGGACSFEARAEGAAEAAARTEGAGEGDGPRSKGAAPSDGSTCCVSSPSRELSAVSQGSDASSPAGVAAAAVAEAADLMRRHRALEAEEVLGRALARLGEAGAEDVDAARAADHLRASEAHAAVCARCQQYDEIAGLLGPPDRQQKLLWEGEGSQLWVHAPAGETWIEYKIILELDLVPEHEPSVLGTPAFLGDAGPWHAVVRIVVGVLLLRVELINEVCRFYNTEHGFLAESIRSDFPTEGRRLPPRHWRNMRVSARVSNMWIPRGGGCSGTTIVQSSRVDAGVKIPDRILAFFFGQLAPSMVRNLRKNSKSVGSPDGPYAPRLAEDRLGIYAECARVEEAAARRRARGSESLPGQDWLSRPWRLAAGPLP
ncbi:unnamed protein product [Prorocentrum cordatum]|uniref:START domain-containing protein n=1 Tax=Prorocentrum cordatum TaxID=2364126 RepID=A0ABN9YGE0_9DINO|nr:unnamed protein product [Polarella glacialis]